MSGGHDGIERSGEQWFRRYNAPAPEKGGARKSRAAKAGDWLEKTREAWAQEANRGLEQADGPSGSTAATWRLCGTKLTRPETWSGRRS